MKRERRKKI